jgi:hypothetical protein
MRRLMTQLHQPLTMDKHLKWIPLRKYALSCPLILDGAGRKAQSDIDRATPEECRYEQNQTDQSDPLPSLNRQAILAGECDESQSNNYP